MLRRPTQHVLSSVTGCQRARRRQLANKTAEEETDLYGDVDSSIFLSHGTGPLLIQKRRSIS